MKGRHVFSNLGFYMIAAILPTLVGFVMLPLYTRYLTPEEYGMVALVLTFQSFLPLLMTLQVHTSITRFYVDHHDDFQQLRIYVSTILAWVLVISTVTSILVLYRLDDIVASLYRNSRNSNELFVLSVFCAFLGVFNSTFAILIRVQQRAKLFMKLSVTLSILSTCVSIIEIIILKRGAYGVIEASFLTAVATFTVYLMQIRTFLTTNINVKMLKGPLNYSLPLVPHSFAGLLFMYSDRFILEKYVPIGAIGIYLFASKVAMLLKMVVMEFNNAFLPHFNNMSRESKVQAIDDLRGVSIIFIYAIAMCISLFAPFARDFVMFLFDFRYLEAWPIIPILMLGFYFQAHYIFSAVGIFYEKKTTVIAICTITTGVLALVLNLLFIPDHGIYAASINFAVSYFFLFIFSNWVSAKIYFTKFVDKRIVGIGVFTILSVLSSELVTKFSIIHTSFAYLPYIMGLIIASVGVAIGASFKLFDFSSIRKIIKS